MELRTPALEKFFQKQWGKSRSKKNPLQENPAGDTMGKPFIFGEIKIV